MNNYFPLRYAMRTYYTLREAVTAMTSDPRIQTFFTDIEYILGNIDIHTHSANLFADMLFNLDNNLDWLDNEDTDKYYNEFLRRFLVKYSKYNIYFTYKDTDENLTADDVKTKWIAIFDKLHNTGDQYIKLIKSVEENIDNLLTDKAVTTSSFNDTPQSNGDYSDKTHNTTVTTSESNLPLASKLETYNALIKDYYDSWLNEFNQFFVY